MQFHETLRSGRHLAGTFIKTPHHAVVEVLGQSGLDFLILDSEHAMFGWADIDRAVLAARHAGMPCLVRLADDRPADMLRVLDCGADGFLVPHVTCAAQAEAIARAAHYGARGRGYAATTRAGEFGARSMAEHLAASAAPVVIAQIEDPEGVENAAAIAAVSGLSAIFLGPADLAVAYGETSTQAPRVQAAMAHVTKAARAAGLPAATFAADMAGALALFRSGFTMAAIASEQKAMLEYFSPEAVRRAKPGGAA